MLPFFCLRPSYSCTTSQWIKASWRAKHFHIWNCSNWRLERSSLLCMFLVLSIEVTAFMLLCSFGILQLNWFKMPMLEKRDLFWWYELFVLICLCFLTLSGEKHIIKKCCFTSKITFHTWIYFVSFWNCLRPLVRLILKNWKKTQLNKKIQKTPTCYSTFFFFIIIIRSFHSSFLWY